jgi:hypothetical protein
MKMRKYALLLAAAVTIVSTSCKKETVRSSKGDHSETSMTRVSGGIKSIDSWSAITSVVDDFGVAVWGQKPDITISSFGPVSGTSSLYTYGAAGSYEAFMYEDGGAHWVVYDVNGLIADMQITFAGSIAGVEEIEVNPIDREIYALVRMNRAGQMGLYHVDLNSGSAYWVKTFHAAGAGTPGAITFVPNGSSGYKLLYVYEPVANSSAVMNYYSVSTPVYSPTFIPPTVSSLTSVSVSGNFVSGTGGLNICYGNSRLYFARDAGNLYQQLGTSLPTSGTVSPFGTFAESDANISNRYDFAYYGL